MEIPVWTEKELMKGAEPIFLKGEKDVGVLLLHGWSSSPQEFNPDFTESTAEYLNRLGYTVYIPLHKGHGTEPKDLLDVGWEDWLSGAREAYDFLAKETENIIVGGMSMGANIALMLATEKPVIGVIPMGTPIFFRMHYLGMIYAWFIRNRRELTSKRYRKRDAYIANKKVHYLQYPPQSAYEAIDSRKPVKKILKFIKDPILIMHSATDNVIHPFSAQYVYMKVKSKDKKLVFIRDSYHSFTTDEHSDEANRIMGKFIDRISPR